MPDKVFPVSSDDALKRLDIFLSEKAGLSRSQAKKFIDAGKVTVSGSPAMKPGEKLKEGDIITLPDGAAHISEARWLAPEHIPLEILYKDDYIIVVDKPAGLVVYPAVGHPGGTLMNALAFYTGGKLATIGAPLRAGVVHRLDKDTSGVIVVAVNDKAYYGLLSQFKDRMVSRSYLALVHGKPAQAEGVINLPIGRSISDRKKMSVRSRAGRQALTSWKLIESFSQKTASLVEARLGTGRTHQIRVHMASAGHPVLGDSTYGRKTSIEFRGGKILIPRQMLHARTLGFKHPISGEQLEFSSPLPEDMAGVIEKLRGLGL
ncbi:MAG: RluA family pseudouridine synthase [Actinomycetota bacterium]|nr:RluA family pseudouridine synthase [Actinomycetota bacterium]